MARQKGSVKTGGREAGTPNRTTSELRDRIKLFLTDNFDLIQSEFIKLDPAQKMNAYERLLKYTIPVMGANDLKIDFENMTDGQLDMIIAKILKK